jgi:hypothetical protein
MSGRQVEVKYGLTTGKRIDMKSERTKISAVCIWFAIEERGMGSISSAIFCKNTMGRLRSESAGVRSAGP